MSRYNYKGQIVSSGQAVATSGVYQRTLPESDRNLMNPDKISRGLLSNNGSVNSAFNSAISDYIPCSEGQIVSSGFIHQFYKNPWFTATYWMPHAYAVCFYDKDKKLITGLSVNTGAPSSESNKNTSITNVVPSGAKFVRVGFHQVAGSYYFYSDKTPEKCYVYVGDSEVKSPAYYFKDGTETYSQDDAPYKGKTWVLFGDSTVDAWGGHDWQAYSGTTEGIDYLWASKIARELGLTIDNRAHSGSNINLSYVYHDVSGVTILDKFLAEIESGETKAPDYITIHFGANTLKDEIGTVDDESGQTMSAYAGVERTTLQGAVKYFVDKLRKKCPNTVIGFILPYQCQWSGQNSVTDESYSRSPYGGYKAIKEVLDTMEYNVPYLDLWQDSGIQVSMLSDGIHEGTAQSQNLYYHAMRRFMMGL